MSNPGVYIFVDKDIDGQSFRVEDNIGEGIHVHFGGSMRLDMTIAEFLDFSSQVADLMNALLDIPGVDCDNLDPIYLNEQAANFAMLERMEIDHVALADLQTEYYDDYGCKYFDGIADSRVTKAFQGDTESLQRRKQTNPYGETNITRFARIAESIHAKGYPVDGRYIIVHNDGVYIRDGLHRASSLLHYHGNKRVPVMRLHFRNGFSSDAELYADARQEREKALQEREKDLVRLRKTRIHLKSDYQCMAPDLRRHAHGISIMALNGILRGRSVAIKGAGMTARTLLKAIERDIDVRCCLSNKDDGKELAGIPVVCDKRVDEFGVDVIVISSFKHRDSMLDDLLALQGEWEIVDIYEFWEAIGCPLNDDVFL